MDGEEGEGNGSMFVREGDGRVMSVEKGFWVVCIAVETMIWYTNVKIVL